MNAPRSSKCAMCAELGNATQLAAGDPRADRLGAGRGDLVEAADGDQRRRADRPDRAADVPVLHRAVDLEPVMAPQLVVDGPEDVAKRALHRLGIRDPADVALDERLRGLLEPGCRLAGDERSALVVAGNVATRRSELVAQERNRTCRRRQDQRAQLLRMVAAPTPAPACRRSCGRTRPRVRDRAPSAPARPPARSARSSRVTDRPAPRTRRTRAGRRTRPADRPTRGRRATRATGSDSRARRAGRAARASRVP